MKHSCFGNKWNPDGCTAFKLVILNLWTRTCFLGQGKQKLARLGDEKTFWNMSVEPMDGPNWAVRTRVSQGPRQRPTSIWSKRRPERPARVIGHVDCFPEIIGLSNRDESIALCFDLYPKAMSQEPYSVIAVPYALIGNSFFGVFMGVKLCKVGIVCAGNSRRSIWLFFFKGIDNVSLSSQLNSEWNVFF